MHFRTLPRRSRGLSTSDTPLLQAPERCSRSLWRHALTRLVSRPIAYEEPSPNVLSDLPFLFQDNGAPGQAGLALRSAVRCACCMLRRPTRSLLSASWCLR